MEKVKLKQGLKITMRISGEGNAYLQESKFWKLYREDLPSSSTVLKKLSFLHQVSLYGEKGDVEKAKRPWEMIPSGHRIGIPVPLLRELRDEDVELLRERFANSWPCFVIG
ncbi:unnamed protein product [Lactuca saligna]|uniref:Uncharacterized protein n=1 Tax=Lactuca saligna TaxID=75948 RepID=A0AA35ZZE1_LACSI|nr:unnamed protein product [Lactuca saligna]